MKKNFVILLPLIVLSANSLFLLVEYMINLQFSNWRTYAALLGTCSTAGITIFFLRKLRRRGTAK